MRKSLLTDTADFTMRVHGEVASGRYLETVQSEVDYGMMRCPGATCRGR